MADDPLRYPVSPGLMRRRIEALERERDDLMARLEAFEMLAAGGPVSKERYLKDPVYHALVHRFIPTPDEIESAAARIGAAAYASDAVARFEEWTQKRWNVRGSWHDEHPDA